MIYLDNAATTKPSREVVEAVRCAMEDTYGNPSSLHAMGADASRAMEEARRSISSAIGSRPEDITFTSGGTEANNGAIRGVAHAMAPRGRHLIATEIEHPSVYQVFQDLEDDGFSVDYIGVDRLGVVDPSDVSRALRDDTTLVSVMLVNNEVGSIQPVRRIREAMGRGVCLHVDGVQAFGKMRVNVKALGADLMTLSGHKIHAPKGVGALYKAPGVRLRPLIVGGQQERGLRAGTEGVPSIVGFGVAAAMAASALAEAVPRMTGLRDRLVKGLTAIPGSSLNGSRDGAPHIVSMCFSDVPAETLVHHLAARGVIVSTRSACSSRKKSPNRVLKALGLSDEGSASAIRIGLSRFTTMAEIETAIGAVGEAVREIRAFRRG